MSFKTYQVSRGLTYNYIYAAPSETSSPKYILFIHGWPSLAREWHYQIDHFSKLGYGVIAPDCLGYGGSSLPSAVEDYSLRKIGQDLVDILDHEKVDQVIGVGHDWGVPIVTRAAFYFPNRFSKLAFLAIGYMVIGRRFEVDAINELTKEALGYSLFGYMKWFNEESTAAVMDEHFESIHSMVYPDDPALWKTHFCPLGAFEKWVKDNKTNPTAKWVTKEDLAFHKQAFSATGYQPSLNYYKLFVRNLQMLDEQDISEEQNTIQKPVLLLTARDDAIGLPSLQIQWTQPYAPQLEIKEVPGGHWIQLECPDEVNAALEEFFSK